MLQMSSPNVQMRSLPNTARLEHQDTIIVSDESDIITSSPLSTRKLENRLSLSSSQTSSTMSDKLRYGELVVLGYNGGLTSGDRGRKKSKFSLHRRNEANGVRPSKKTMVNNPKDSKIIQDKEQHSVSYTLSRSQSVIVQYERDKDTDMFQIGRSSEPPIDCVVMDTVPAPQRSPNAQSVAQSTISRFSCRICIDRNPPHIARIFAAGFDSQRNIFLGEKASKWHNHPGDVDGLTTNGILIMHPHGQLTTGECRPGIWREVSVGGGVYSLRATRSVPSKSQKIDTETNILQDGTLIDLCGATLVWRSDGGLGEAPTGKQLESFIEMINAARPQCPVGLNTLVLPKKNAKIDKTKQPYVYLACGHVHGEHEWGASDRNGKRTCPMCLTEGPFVQVQVGSESSMYVDSELLTHAFTPCAHMASAKTVQYWASVAIPYGCQGFRAMCPFCATPLAGDTGYIKLVFQDNTEF